ncbi:MAG TPA: S9 family peptidase [Candidatus Limnocylindrales bacterium]|nr:S9 family peptidase [Candidatus Limnocylindrales bacterium]
MSAVCPCIALAFFLAMTVSAQTPPVAPRVDHREVRHGATVVDEYFWLREKSNPQVREYLESENAYTAAMTKSLEPFSGALYEEMLGRIKQTDLSVPAMRHGYLYYSRTEEGKQYPIQCRRKGTMIAPEEVLLDLNELGEGHKFVGLGRFMVSEDQNMLAYTLDFSGFRQYTLRVKDLRNGKTLPDTFERVTSLAWAADNKTIFLTTEDAVTKRPDRLFRHTIATEKFEQLFNEKDELYDIGISKTRDEKYLLLESESKDTSETRYLRADRPSGQFTVFLAREKGHRYYVDHREGLFYIRTNKPGHNFAIVTAPESDPAPKNWKTFVAHRADTRIQHLDLFRDFAVSVERGNALDHLRIYDFHIGRWSEIGYPESVYSVFPGGTADYESKTYRYTYQSFLTPASVYDYEVASGKSTLLKRQEVLGGYDPANYAAERLWATARDGVKVPVSIVYRKGFQRDGHGALFLYAYGSYGMGTPPTFSSDRVSLLDRAMAYAIAHIRGGDEMGEQWREDGMLMKKKNTFNDFVDCAEFLIQQKWTNRDRLVIEGGSAGGLLMGAVVNQRPDLFKAVHAAVPFVDVMNTMMDATLPLTVGEYLEWGNPNEKAAYDYMKTYSPYDNLEKRAYPAMLVTTSFNDSQVMYWEPAKYVARLRSLKTDSNPLLLKIKMDPAGHGGASGRYDRLHDNAFIYAWMLSQAGITK